MAKRLVAEYSTQISQTPEVSYLTQDHLGSPRVVTDQLGAVKERKDYSAFGEETISPQRNGSLGYAAADEVRKGYTGYEKDNESGLDFAQARYYNSTHGRFTSVDPLTASASIRDPQTFNRYSYVLNSPYKYTDPLGLMALDAACGGSCPGSFMGIEGDGYFSSKHGDVWKKQQTEETITLNLNIVYDENQYSLAQAKEAVAGTVKDLQKTLSRIAVRFNITYTAGRGDPATLNSSGEYGRIASGAKAGSINAFLSANNKSAGRSGSSYNPGSEQIFMWEGSMAERPNATNATAKLSSVSLAHEIGHLFFHWAGVPMRTTLANNISQDAGIAYTLNQMRYNPLFSPDPDLPKDFDYNKTGISAFRWPSRKSKFNPTYEQLLRYGARGLAENLNEVKK